MGLTCVCVRAWALGVWGWVGVDPRGGRGGSNGRAGREVGGKEDGAVLQTEGWGDLVGMRKRRVAAQLMLVVVCVCVCWRHVHRPLSHVYSHACTQAPTRWLSPWRLASGSPCPRWTPLLVGVGVAWRGEVCGVWSGACLPATLPRAPCPALPCHFSAPVCPLGLSTYSSIYPTMPTIPHLLVIPTTSLSLTPPQTAWLSSMLVRRPSASAGSWLMGWCWWTTQLLRQPLRWVAERGRGVGVGVGVAAAGLSVFRRVCEQRGSSDAV